MYQAMAQVIHSYDTIRHTPRPKQSTGTGRGQARRTLPKGYHYESTGPMRVPFPLNTLPRRRPTRAPGRE